MPSAPTPPTGRGLLAPDAPLTGFHRNDAERQQFLRRIFDDTTLDDARIECVLALGCGPWCRRQTLPRRVEPGVFPEGTATRR